MNFRTALAYEAFKRRARKHAARSIPSRAVAKRATFAVRRNRRDGATASMLHNSNQHPRPFTSLACYTPEKTRLKFAQQADRRIRLAIERAERT
jgi:hypothetical protein